MSGSEQMAGRGGRAVRCAVDAARGGRQRGQFIVDRQGATTATHGSCIHRRDIQVRACKPKVWATGLDDWTGLSVMQMSTLISQRCRRNKTVSISIATGGDNKCFTYQQMISA